MATGSSLCHYQRRAVMASHDDISKIMANLKNKTKENEVLLSKCFILFYFILFYCYFLK